MSRSEEYYFEMIFPKLSNLQPNTVLEIGFGLGISAALIQKYLKPSKHDIVEIESSVFDDLERFSYRYPSVRAFAGDWRKIELEEKYDFIFYDPYDYFPQEVNSSKVGNKAMHLKNLLHPTGILCHPHFGDGDVPDLFGFNTVILDRMTVPQISMADGSFCEDVAIVFHRPSS